VSLVLTAAPSPFALDFDEAGDRLCFVSLTEADFRAASFLDERVLAGGAVGSWLATAEVGEFAKSLAGESDFIFHIGHVGSTLVSRLLGAGERIFAVREPALLRSLARRPWLLATGEPAADPSFSRLALSLKLLSRVWRPGQRSQIKTTSFVSDIAPQILAASPTARALLMFVAPQIHIATRLAGPATRAELPAIARGWLERLHGRLGGDFWRLEALSEGERAALGWACEICALAQVARRFPERVRWLEFEGFLADPAAGLGGTVGFLRGAPLDGEIAAMLESGDLRRYSKAPEHSYDAQTRRQTIEQGLRGHGTEIERGIAWLNAAGRAHPLIADAAVMAAQAARARRSADA
jgi:hypothetical protein